MSLKTSNYGAARGVLGLAEILLWCGIGLGIIIAIMAGGAASRGFGSPGLLAAGPGLIITVVCFIGVVQVQMAKASVDTADYTYQMLGIARDQLAVSKKALAQPAMPQSFSARPAAGGASAVTKEMQPAQSFGGSQPETSEQIAAPQRDQFYRGMRIQHRSDGSFQVRGRNFETVELAKLHIDGVALRAELAAPRGAAQ